MSPSGDEINRSPGPIRGIWLLDRVRNTMVLFQPVASKLVTEFLAK